MRIEITRSGGFAGLTRTWSLEVSRTEAEQRWLPLAEAEAGGGEAGGGEAAVATTAGRSGPSAGRDRFTYRIAIGYTEVEVPESRLEDPWRELIERARATAAAPAAPSASAAEGSATEGSADTAFGRSTGKAGGAGGEGPDPGFRPSGDADPGKPEELL